MNQSIACVATVLATIAQSVFPSSPAPVPNVPNEDDASESPFLPLELIDPLLALTIRLTCASTGATTTCSSHLAKQVLDVISQSCSASSLTLQAALLHGLPWFTVGHATGTCRRRIIDEGDGHDSSTVRVSLLHALARPHARWSAAAEATARSKLVPVSFQPSDLILASTSTLTDQLQVCDWWTQNLPLPTIAHLAPLILVSPHAEFLTRYLLTAHATLGTAYADADMDATLTLLASLASDALTYWYRHAYAGPLKSLASVTAVLYLTDTDALKFAHDVATPPRVARHAILRACALGHVHALVYYASIGCAVDPSPLALDVASRAGHVKVLEWWVRQSGMPVKYSEDAVDAASRAGHLEVLEWWWARAQCGEGDFLYTEASVDGASAEGRLQVLRWWANKPNVKYSNEAVHDTALNGHVHVLAWWAEIASRLPVKMDLRRLARQLSAKLEGSGVGVLEWWMAQSKLPSLIDAVDVRILESCATRKAIDFWLGTLGLFGGSKWWRQCTWPKLTFTVPATVDKQLTMWWARESGLAFTPSTDLITYLATQGDIQGLTWWSRRGGLPALRGQDVFKVMHTGRVDMLSWFAAHGGEIVVQEYAVLVEAAKTLDPRVVDWVVARYYRGNARMSTQWDGIVEAVDAYGMDGKETGGVKGFVGMGGVRLVG